MTLIFALALAAGRNPPDAPVVQCPEDRQATAITLTMSGLPEEIRSDLNRETGGRIGERPRALRHGDIVTDENREQLTSRFYRGLLIRRTWYVQVELTQMEGVHTLAYATFGGDRYRRTVDMPLSGPPSETITAALAGVSFSGTFIGN